MNKTLKKSIIIGGGVVAGLLALWGGFNLGKAITYHEYYSITKFDGKTPGLSDNAVQQGVTVDNDGNYIIATYMMNGKDPSRIYIKDKNEKVRFVELYEDDEFKIPCVRHCGGIQFVEKTGKLYLADATKFVISLDYEKVMNNDKVSVKGLDVKVNNEASFVYTDETYVYVGEFNKTGSNWPSENEITYNGETHKAICSRYPINEGSVDFNSPDRIYSICDLAQGIAFKDNKMYVSTSWAVSSSHLKIFDLSKAVKIDPYQGVETYFVSEISKDLLMPAMSEDLDTDKDGNIITVSEAASNKYVFGKFLFLDEISVINI